MPGDEEVTLGELGRRVDGLTAAVEKLRDTITGLSREFVPRDLWLQRNGEVDGRFRDQGREIGDLRTAVDLKANATDVAKLEERIQAPPRWPAVLSSLTSVAALVVAALALTR